jgi:DNA ligase (NAD+)
MDVTQLVSRLQAAREAYYNGSPLMSDAAYDTLEDELRKADPNHPLLKQIGAVVPGSSGWPKVKHGQRMSSLNKAQVVGDLQKWWASCGKPEIHVTEKLDGISISLRYEDGFLIQALTRGDGDVGEDITRNVLMMKGMPARAGSASGAFTGYVRGEIVCKKSDFAAYFPGESNPRNTASGTAKRQSNPDKCKHLTVIAYQYLPDSGDMATKADEMDALGAFGFEVPFHGVGTTLSYAEGVYEQYVDKARDALDYDIDGLVIEANDTGDRDALGDHNNRPKGAVAFKFPHESKQTTLRNIRWQVGNSGRVTPVAIFDSVNLAGANVSKASLHNIGYYTDIAGQIGQQVLTAGDTILVSRRNDVIPYVEAGIEGYNEDDADDHLLPIPTECPDCKTALKREGAYLVCPNTMTCSAQIAGMVKRWIKKVGILDWGESVIDALCEQGLVADPADLYTLEDDVLSEVQMSGRRVGSSAKKMLDNLHAKKDLPLHVIVGSIGIPMIGRSMARTITLGGYDTLDKLFKATTFQIGSISGVGTTKAKHFVKGMEDGIGLICRLLGAGVTIAKPAANGPLKGKLVCMTGFRDPSMASAIEAQGGVVKSSVSKKLDYLVMKDPASTSGKAKKARGYGINLISIDDMNALLGR